MALSMGLECEVADRRCKGPQSGQTHPDTRFSAQRRLIGLEDGVGVGSCLWSGQRQTAGVSVRVGFKEEEGSLCEVSW